ncbi:MAG: polysaccharide deacetylase family protein [Candidatus Altiarchaeota archaeon]
MNAITYVLKNRGIWGALKRALEIISSYGFTEKKFSRKLELYLKILSEYNVKASLSATGVVVSRHPDFFRKLGSRAELLIHGFRHVDQTQLGKSQQKDEVLKALDAFKKAGLTAKGFRAPYLRKDKNLAGVLKGRFEYDSSDSILFNSEFKIPCEKTTENVKSMPYADEVLELMVSLPSDIWLLNKLGIKSQDEITKIWRDMLKQAHEKGEMLILQLHPENIEKCDRALAELLKYSRSLDGVWTPTLGGIASWWKSKKPDEKWPKGFKCALSITGDIDCTTLLDYLHRLFEGLT